MKHIMPKIINKSQSAFIPRRYLSDNILLAQELFRSYNRQTYVPKCSHKIDLHKAFDSISWSFIVDVMAFMNFPLGF